MGGARGEQAWRDCLARSGGGLRPAYGPDRTGPGEGCRSRRGGGHLADRYAILPCGGSFGDGYGPLLVSRQPLNQGDLKGCVIAIPGTLTSAYLALRLFAGAVNAAVVPFDQIPSHLRAGKADAGLLIHEAQLTYADSGLHKVADLGEWW